MDDYMTKKQVISGLCSHPQSNIHLLCPDKKRCNETLICRSEIGDSKGEGNGLQHLVEDHLEYILDVGPLCIFKEFPCGHGGAVDFLAINGAGLVFLVEVKRAKDQRAKFDVVFQVLKYHCFPAEILQQLSQEFIQSTLMEKLGMSSEKANTTAELARTNIENRLMNPVIMVDEASFPLIAHAYSLALRDIDGELRVFEINIQSICSVDYVKPLDFVYVRKFCSNDEWIGNECSNNRKPTQYTSYDDKLSEILDEKIRTMAIRLLRDTGIKMPRAAKSMKCFAIVPDYAYFSFDPNGHICAGAYSRIDKPDTPCRVIAVNVEKDEEQSLLAAGFREIMSHNGKNDYFIFDLSSTTTDEELACLVTILQEFQSAKESE